MDPALFYWQKNGEQYEVDDEGVVTLTDKATPEAIESFEKYVKKYGNQHPIKYAFILPKFNNQVTQKILFD